METMLYAFSYRHANTQSFSVEKTQRQSLGLMRFSGKGCVIQPLVCFSLLAAASSRSAQYLGTEVQRHRAGLASLKKWKERTDVRSLT